ncbi:MAG: glucoamylase family protein [Planctomycetota bacterium]|jgi:hypothetical protein
MTADGRYREPVYGGEGEDAGAGWGLRALPRHLRVDLVWEGELGPRYEVERSASPGGPWKRLDDGRRIAPVFSDFLGEAGKAHWYRVRRQIEKKRFTEWSEAVRGESSRAANREELLTELQEACFRYFWHGGHPTSGLALEGIPRGTNPAASGATGMGLFTLVVGIERGFVPRAACVKRLLKMLRFLRDKAERFHGGWPHWINGASGKVIPFGREDNEADIVETAYLAEGLVFLREYFTRDTPDEAEVRRIADKLWRDIDWAWFVRKGGRGQYIKWHSADAKKLGVHGFNECQIVYLLALGSPTHAVKPEVYWSGWEGYRGVKPTTHFGVENGLGKGMGGPLFFTHYSYMGFDPNAISFRGRSYFEHFKNLALIQARYAESRRDDFKGYGPLWGLTASYSPDGYKAHRPGRGDNGTITPTAALSSIPYAPEEGIACLVEMYEKHGGRLWGEFGFYDAFNMTRDWVSHGFLGIDQGPIAPMIENHRTGLCWKTFMKAPEMQRVVKMLDEKNRPK